MKKSKIAIVGTVGVPAKYGGFETLVENLVKYHFDNKLTPDITVWCSRGAYGSAETNYLSASLKYVALNANGPLSPVYDAICLFQAVRSNHSHILLLGVSGAIFLPFVRLLSNAKIVTNIDGIEWKRDKWSRFSKVFLKVSELIAVKFSHKVISDNQEIANHVLNAYGDKSAVIAYGGDHALEAYDDALDIDLPSEFYLSVCRIEPENNVHLILEAFSKTSKNLVFIGNWGRSEYGAILKKRYQSLDNIVLLDPIYDTKRLSQIRSQALAYVHGHSAGGTNPSLVEIMHFGLGVIAFNCKFNIFTTNNNAVYFNTSLDLIRLLESIDHKDLSAVGQKMLAIAKEMYTWDTIGQQYFTLMDF